MTRSIRKRAPRVLSKARLWKSLRSLNSRASKRPQLKKRTKRLRQQRKVVPSQKAMTKKAAKLMMSVNHLKRMRILSSKLLSNSTRTHVGDFMSSLLGAKTKDRLSWVKSSTRSSKWANYLKTKAKFRTNSQWAPSNSLSTKWQSQIVSDNSIVQKNYLSKTNGTVTSANNTNKPLRRSKFTKSPQYW